PSPVPSDDHGGGLEVVIQESVQRWLAMLERNRGMWLAAIGAQGVGRDPEVEAILDDAREQAADHLIAALQRYRTAAAPPAVRAAMRAYAGFAEAATVQWLQRRRLTREQIEVLLVRGFLSIVEDVLPAIEQLAGDAG
ncbi:MAG: TetR/AcrR family transcriptional regulator, partial [Solirubrobacteraceae bacterium]